MSYIIKIFFRLSTLYLFLLLRAQCAVLRKEFEIIKKKHTKFKVILNHNYFTKAMIHIYNIVYIFFFIECDKTIIKDTPMTSVHYNYQVQPMSSEQKELIYRLVHFQDQYEVPTEKDLERLTINNVIYCKIYLYHT